jgi:hypothetical protein
MPINSKEKVLIVHFYKTPAGKIQRKNTVFAGGINNEE